MKLINKNSKYYDYFGIYTDFYNFDDLFGSTNLGELLEFFKQEGYQFESFTISFQSDHSDIQAPIGALSEEELFDELKEINHGTIELIDTFGFHNDKSFTMQIYPNSGYVKVERVERKKENSQNKKK